MERFSATVDEFDDPSPHIGGARGGYYDPCRRPMRYELTAAHELDQGLQSGVLGSNPLPILPSPILIPTTFPLFAHRMKTYR